MSYFKVKKGLVPDYMCEHFAFQNIVHSHRKRFCKDGTYDSPTVKKALVCKHIVTVFAKSAKKLPAQYRNARNVKKFKSLTSF